MSSFARIGQRDDHDVAGTDGDLLVTARTAVGLRGTVGLDAAQLGGPSGEWVGDETRFDVAVVRRRGHVPVSRPDKTATVSLLGLGLCVRPEASARGTDRRAVVSSILECALMAEGLGLSAFVIDDTPTDNLKPGESSPSHFHANVARWNSRNPISVSYSSLESGGSGRPCSSTSVMGCDSRHAQRVPFRRLPLSFVP